MRGNILNRLLLLAFLPLLFSCKAKRQLIQPVTVAPDPVPVTAPLVDQRPAISVKDTVLNSIAANQTNFNTLSFRAKTDLAIEGKTNDVTMNVKMEKDKTIWISVTALVGLEVGRVLITPDSIKIRDNINGVYTKKPFSYLYYYTNQKFTFSTLQSFLVGSFPAELLDDSALITITDKSPFISGMLSTLAYSFSFNDGYRLTQTRFKDELAKQSLQVNYGDFGSFSSKILPQSVNIQSTVGDRSIGLDMKYSRVETDQPIDIPFSIPARFKVKE